MSEIAEKLRILAKRVSPHFEEHDRYKEAADELDRLTSRIAALEAERARYEAWFDARQSLRKPGEDRLHFADLCEKEHSDNDRLLAEERAELKAERDEAVAGMAVARQALLDINFYDALTAQISVREMAGKAIASLPAKAKAYAAILEAVKRLVIAVNTSGGTFEMPTQGVVDAVRNIYEAARSLSRQHGGGVRCNKTSSVP